MAVTWKWNAVPMASATELAYTLVRQSGERIPYAVSDDSLIARAVKQYLAKGESEGKASAAFVGAIRQLIYVERQGYSSTDPIVTMEVAYTSIYAFTFTLAQGDSVLTVDLTDVHHDAITGRPCAPAKLACLDMSPALYRKLREEHKFRAALTHKLPSAHPENAVRFLVNHEKWGTIGEFTQCPECGCFVTEEERRITEDGSTLCALCLSAHVTECIECHRMWRNASALVTVRTSYRPSSAHMCRNCVAQRETYVCSACGVTVVAGSSADVRESGDDEPLCYACVRSSGSTELHNYSYKPTPLFKSNLIPDPTEHSVPLFMGIELEIDVPYGSRDEDDDDEEECEGYNSDRIAREIHAQVDPRGRLIYCKTDGSLNHGVEIVCHPATLTYHQQWKWPKLLECARNNRYFSYGTSTCGMHVHVNRTFFQETEYCSPMMHFGKALYFYQKNKNDLMAFSSRDNYSYCTFADMMSESANDTQLQDTASTRWRCGGERYRAINMNNQQTVEFRMFRGTLHPTLFFANLELLDIWLRAASVISFKAMRQWDLLHLLKTARVWDQDRYKHLIAFTIHRFPMIAETAFGKHVNAETLQLINELSHTDLRQY